MASLVWITGASSGLGAAMTTAVPWADAHVVDVSRSGGGPAAEHLPADLADPASWAAVAAHLAARLGDADPARAVFVHGAGTIEPIGFAGEVDAADYRRNVLLNAAAPQVLGQAFLAATAHLTCERALVLLSSGAATHPYPGWSGYSAGKAAVDAWVRAVGAEQARRPNGARVLAVRPGVLDTGMQARIRATDTGDFPAVDRFRALHASGGLVDPADAARRLWAWLDSGPSTGTVADLP